MKLIEQVKVYDYTSRQEADRHRQKMIDKGWLVELEILEDGCDEYKWIIKYKREH